MRSSAVVSASEVVVCRVDVHIRYEKISTEGLLHLVYLLSLLWGGASIWALRLSG